MNVQSPPPALARHARRSFRRLLQATGAIMVLLVVLAAGGAAYQAVVSARERELYPPPGKMVDVNGLRMHVACQGEGSPTVILDAGGGDNSLTWSLVQPELARITRVCAFDRPGLGWSDEAAGPHEAEHAADRLHALLQAAGEPGPYLLVGHSAAGLYDRVFAARYRPEVVGLVLVDPTPLVPPDDSEVLGILGSGLPLPLAAPAAVTGLHRILLWPGIVENALPTRRLPAEVQAAYRATRYRTSALSTAAAEEGGLLASIDQALSAGDLGDMPVTVLMAEISDADRAAVSSELLQVLERAKRLQAAHAEGSTRSDVVMVSGTGHFIHVDRPDVVRDSIIRMIEDGEDSPPLSQTSSQG